MSHFVKKLRFFQNPNPVGICCVCCVHTLHLQITLNCIQNFIYFVNLEFCVFIHTVVCFIIDVHVESRVIKQTNCTSWLCLELLDDRLIFNNIFLLCLNNFDYTCFADSKQEKKPAGKLKEKHPCGLRHPYAIVFGSTCYLCY
jgi:hypothetical protein